jgi:hypothetical protein
VRSELEDRPAPGWSGTVAHYVLPFGALPTAIASGASVRCVTAVVDATAIWSVSEAFSALANNLDFRIATQNFPLWNLEANPDFSDVMLERTPKAVRRLKGTVVRKSRTLGLSETAEELSSLLDAPHG